MVSPRTDPVGVAIIDTLADLGYDYIELSLSHIAGLDDSDFADVVRRVKRSGLNCEACNFFFPPTVRLTGPQADLAAAVTYATAAIARAARLGAEVIVFGSSGAKNVPAGFPRDAAWQQIVGLLRTLGPIAEQHGVTIAVEHLNRLESNIVIYAAEALRLVSEVAHPSIQMVIDYYHLVLENEDVNVILKANTAIRHVHFAEGPERLFPRETRDEYITFFDCLNAVHYSQRCSIEAFPQDFVPEARRALAILKEVAKS
jgi:sugar phosphate isomerase/epimerase